MELVSDWRQAEEVLRGLDVADAPAVGHDTLMPPLMRPRNARAAASEVATLEPGDVIATGTPSGVGAGRGLYLRAGDVVRTSIDGLGTLENSVIDASGGPSRSSSPISWR